MGYLVAEAYARQQGWAFKEERQFFAYTARGKAGDVAIHVLLPTTYMNESGRSLRLYLDFYKLDKDHVCVVCDDIDLAFGQIRLRSMGSAGGHNGLKSIQLHLNTQNYVRMRMGIGREQKQHQTLAEYVLEVFTPEERMALPAIVANGVAVIQRLVNEELSTVMNTVNIRPRTETEKSGEQ